MELILLLLLRKDYSDYCMLSAEGAIQFTPLLFSGFSLVWWSIDISISTWLRANLCLTQQSELKPVKSDTSTATIHSDVFAVFLSPCSAPGALRIANDTCKSKRIFF